MTATPESSDLIRQLRSTLGRLELAIGLVTESIVWISADGRVQWCNRSFDDLVGKARIEILGKDGANLLALRRGGRPLPRAEHPVTLARKTEAQITSLYELERCDGQLVLEISATRAELGDEAPIIMLVIRDVTARALADEEMRRLNAQLETANRELEAFSYSVSHDLRAPLRSIDGFSQVLLDDYAAHLDTEGQGVLRRICAAAQRMAHLIDDLLLLSSVTRADLGRSVIDLSDLARAIAAKLQRAEPERSVEFVIGEGLQAEGDARLLRLVLENLLGNAWKFTARRARATIEFGATGSNGQVAYYVRDNGVGFDAAYVSKLFVPFQRLHTSGDFPGTGIGLATVRRVIQRHGGRVWAEGAVDRGATFSFTLS